MRLIGDLVLKDPQCLSLLNEMFSFLIHIMMWISHKLNSTTARKIL